MTSRKRKVTLTLPDEFLDLCEQDGCNPVDVLDGFVADVCELETSGGSDERMYARQYYDRRGWPYLGKWKTEGQG